jgi:hypothetical protein
MLSQTRTLSTGAPQGCGFSPILFTLFTNDCRSQNNSNIIIKFSDDTTLEGLIKNSDETAYRSEVQHMVTWCQDNDLELNVTKTKELIIDFRAKKTPHSPLVINGENVEVVNSFKFLGTTIADTLKWENNISLAVKKAQQRLHFLRQLKRFGVSQPILAQFYRAVVESVLTFSVTVWYGGATEHDKHLLDSVVKTASHLVGCQLPSVSSIYESRVSKRAANIIRDTTHPANHLFQLLPSGRRYRTIRAKTNRQRDSFFHEAVRILNNFK